MAATGPSFSWAVISDPGLRRTSNEDCHTVRPDVGLFVVADGMGGHVAGEVASRIAVEAIEAFTEETAGADRNRTWPFPFDPTISLEANRLKTAFRLANRRIAAAVADSQDLRGMATTASAILCGGRWWRVLPRYILPTAVGPVLALAALDFGLVVLAVSSLGFLGYGEPPPAPEWGALVADGRNYLATAWWLTTLPSLTVTGVVLAANRLSRVLESEGGHR